MRFYRRTAAAFLAVVVLTAMGSVLNRAAEETEKAATAEQQPTPAAPMDSAIIVITYPEPSTEPEEPKEPEEPTQPQPQETARIYENLPLSPELQEFTYNRCQEKGIDYEMVLAIMQKESNYDPQAVSATNDYGIMQINQCNHEWLREELNITDFLDAKESITAGTEILGRLAAKYSRDSEAADPHQILMAYNMGETGAQKAWNAGIMTSAYSRAVMEIRAEILKGETTQ